MALLQAYEWLAQKQRNELRRYAAVLLLKEMARETPTFFFIKAGQFFDNIFHVIRDPKAFLRAEAVEALRAALLVSSQRDASQSNKTQWSLLLPAFTPRLGMQLGPWRYTQSYTEAIECIHQGTDASIRDTHAREANLHSGLLILNELLRIANLDAEVCFPPLLRLLFSRREGDCRRSGSEPWA